MTLIDRWVTKSGSVAELHEHTTLDAATVTAADRHVTLRHGHTVIGIVAESPGSPTDLIEEVTPARARAIAADLIRRADEIERIRSRPGNRITFTAVDETAGWHR